MKILTLSLFLFPIALFAQFSKGDKYVTAGFAFDADNPSGNNAPFNYSSKHSFGINPGVGYFTSNNLAVGIEGGYGHSLQTSTEGGGFAALKYHTHSYSLSPFVRKYWTLSDKFFFSITARIEYSRSFSKLVSKSSSTPNHYLGVSASIVPSLAYFPTKHWSIQTNIGSLSYAFTKKLAHDTHYDNISLSYGMINLGVAYYFQN